MTEPYSPDFANEAYEASNGDVYVTGRIDDVNSAQNIIIARYTSDLVLVSSAQIPSAYGDSWEKIVVDQAGYVYLAGNYGQFDVLRLSPELAVISSRTFAMGWGQMSGLALGEDGSLYISGVAGNASGTDRKGYLLKLNPALTVISSTTVSAGSKDKYCETALDGTGNVYTVVTAQGASGVDVGLVKYDNTLTLLSSATLFIGEGYTGENQAPYELHLALGSTEEVVLGGNLYTGVRAYMARFNGELVFVSSGVLPVMSIKSIAAGGSGKYLIGGEVASGFFIAAVSSALVVESSTTFSQVAALSFAFGQSGNVYVPGTVGEDNYNSNFWLGKLDHTLSFLSSTTVDGGARVGSALDSVVVGPNKDVYISGGGRRQADGWMARYTPDLVMISSVTLRLGQGEVSMAADDAGNIYFHTETLSGAGNNTIYKHNQELQFVSSATFGLNNYVYLSKTRKAVGGIFVFGNPSEIYWQSRFWKLDDGLAVLSTVTAQGDDGYDISSDEMGNLYTVGVDRDFLNSLVLAKYSPDLIFTASTTITGAAGAMVWPRVVSVSTNSQYIFAGGMFGEDGWLGKFDYNLNLVSSITFSGIQPGTVNTEVMDLAIAPDSSILAAGAFHGKLWLARLSPDLVIISSETVDVPVSVYSSGVSLGVQESGNVYVTGEPGWLGWFTYADEAGAQQGVTAAPFTALSTGSLTAVWTSTYQATTLYYASISTSSDFTPVLASSSTYNKSANFSGLAVNTTYYARVYDPLKGAMMDLGSISTLARPPEFLFLDNVWSSSAAISWTPNGNPDWTKYVIVLWDGEVSSVTIASVSTTSAVIGLPEGTTIYLSVSSMNNGGLFPQLYPFISFLTLPAVQTAVQTDLGKMVLYSGVSGEITANIPAGSFTEAVNVTIKTPAPWNVPAPTAGLLALRSPVNLEVTLDKALQPSHNVEITVGYRDADLGGMDESKLVLARYDEAHAVWVPLPSTRDAANNKITAVTRHFSLFQVMQVTPAATLSGVTVGPNPLRPSRNPGQKFTFRNLPADGRVRIYTYLGELLWEANADVSGMAVWDGRNKWNSAVASGLYLALVEGRGGKKLLKLVIER